MKIGTSSGEVIELTPEQQTEILTSLTAPLPTVDDFRRAIQTHVDAKAKERNYDSGHTIATYIGSTVEPWASEAQAFVAWRDQVWLYAYAELEKVENEQRTAPTPEEFVSELPALTWPE